MRLNNTDWRFDCLVSTARRRTNGEDNEDDDDDDVVDDVNEVDKSSVSLRLSLGSCRLCADVNSSDLVSMVAAWT